MVQLTAEQQAEIQQLREAAVPTIRPVSPALEEVLYQPLQVLDHGFIRVIDYMGDDAAIVQAARVSYGKGTKKITEDRGLINYLMRHRHTSPFEMCELKLHVKMPIFIARQWIRHRTANVNEYSGRYSILDKEFYIPKAEHLAAQSATNRQGRDAVITGTRAEHILKLLKDDAEQMYAHYLDMLNLDDDDQPIDPQQDSLARELARMNLSVNYYTQWYWKVDLHNLLHFLKLRADPHAQYEIRVYAEVLLDIVKRWVPLTHDAFQDYRMQGAELSGKGLAVLKRLLSGEMVVQQTSQMSVGEWRELMQIIGREIE